MGDKKTNFSVTCSLLSQYLKQKGSLGDLFQLDITPKPLDQQLAKGSLGKSRTPPTTMCLLPGVDVSEDNHSEDCTEQLESPKSMDLFPQHTGIDDVAVSEAKHEPTIAKSASTTKDQSKAQQLTIFYRGKVLVFDNFPADKANDLFKIASKESISTVPQNVVFKVPPPVPKAETPSKPITTLPSTSSNHSTVVEPENTFPKPANASADMPRRNSLHRFLEKRKDRITTKAPYQVHGGSSAANATKPEDVPYWLGLGRQNSKPEISSENNK